MSPEKDGRDASEGRRDPESRSGPASDDVGRLLNPSPYPSSSTDEIKQILNQAAAGDLQIKLGENVLLGLFTEGERREFVASMEETGLTWEELSQNWDAVKEASSPAPALLYNILCERFTGILLETLGEPAAAVDLLVRLEGQYNSCWKQVSLSSLLKGVPDNAPQIDEKIGRLFREHPFGWAGPEEMFITRVSSWGLEERFISLVENTLRQSFGTDYAPRLVHSWEGIESVFSANTVARIEALIDHHAPAAWSALSEAALERSPSRIEKLIAATPEQGGRPESQLHCCARWMRDMDLPDRTRERLVERLCQLGENYTENLVSCRRELVRGMGEKRYLDLVRDRLEACPTDNLIISVLPLLGVREMKRAWSSVVAQRCVDNARIVVSACERGVSPHKIPGFKSAAAVVAQVLAADMPIDLAKLGRNQEFLKVVLGAKESSAAFFDRCVQTGSATLFFEVIPFVHATSQSTEASFATIAKDIIGAIERAGSRADEIVRDPRFVDLQRAARSSAPLSAGRSLCMEIAYFSPFTSATPEAEGFTNKRGYEPTFIESFILNAAASLDRGSDGHDSDTYRGVLEDIQASAIGHSHQVKEHPLGRFVVGEALGSDFDELLNNHPVCNKLVDPPAKRTSYRYATWGDLEAREAFAVVSATLFDQLSPGVQEQVLGFDPENLRTFFSLLESGVKRGFDLRGAPKESMDLIRSLRADAVTWISTKAHITESNVAERTSSMSDKELLLTLHTLQKLHWFYPEWKDIFVKKLLSPDKSIGTTPEVIETGSSRDTRGASAWSTPLTVTLSKQAGALEVSDALSPIETLRVWGPRLTETWIALRGAETIVPTLLDGATTRTVVVREGANTARPALASVGYSISGEQILMLDLPPSESFSTEALAALVVWGEQRAAALKIPLRASPHFVRALPEPGRGEFLKLHGARKSAQPFVDISNRTRFAPPMSQNFVGRGIRLD